MSLPLIDFRCKLTHRADAVLDAMHMATGRDRSELAREALDAADIRAMKGGGE